MAGILKIGFVGGGKMAQALAKGIAAAEICKTNNMIASNHPTDKASIEAFKNLGAESITDNTAVVEKSDIVFLSVKPQVIPTALKDLKDARCEKLFLSVAMGVTIKTLESLLPTTARVMRVMPNTPALVRSGCSVYSRGTKVTEDDAQITAKLLQAVGTCEQVPESYFDVITALSGSGPAYVFVMIEAIADGGVKMGLPRDLAYRLASQTVLGAGQMVRDTGMHPGFLKDQVTSPAGSTATGLHVLEEKSFRTALISAIEAATKRCIEVSKTN